MDFVPRKLGKLKQYALGPAFPLEHYYFCLCKPQMKETQRMKLVTLVLLHHILFPMSLFYALFFWSEHLELLQLGYILFMCKANVTDCWKKMNL